MRWPSCSASILTLVVCMASVAAAQRQQRPRPLPRDTISRNVHYSGHVQGVGFRAKTVAIARGFPVTGWVKNLPDGRVELQVEGREADVVKFLAAVRAFWADNIDGEAVEIRRPAGTWTGFTVLP